MTVTLHIENTVSDYETWKQAFDKFDRFRRDGGVRRVRVSRRADKPAAVIIELDFDSLGAASAFRDSLSKVWASPQSRAALTGHAAAVIHEVLEQHTLS